MSKTSKSLGTEYRLLTASSGEGMRNDCLWIVTFFLGWLNALEWEIYNDSQLFKYAKHH